MQQPKRRKGLRAAALAATVTLAAAGSIAIGSPASANYCIHDNHWHSNVFYVFVQHHTHSWGDHHHVFNLYEGGSNFLGQVHANCS